MNLRAMNALRKSAAHKSNQYEGISDSALLEGISAYGIPFAGPTNAATTPLGQLVGLVQGIDESNEEELTKKLNRYSGFSFLPGVFGYRDMLRHRLADRKASKGKVDRKALASEFAGNITAPLLTMIAATLAGGGIGAGIGALTGSTNDGTAIGGGIGAGVGAVGSLAAILAGLGLGMYKRRRSMEQHAEYLNSPTLVAKNLLIPGYAAYQTGRRVRNQAAASLDA